MKIILLAPRNLIRSWQRSLVTTLAMGFAGVIMILFGSLMDGMLQASERSATMMNTGELQLHAKSYLDDPDLYTVITNEAALLEKLSAAGVSASPRLFSFALAAAGTSSAGVQLRGITPSLEAQVTEIHKHLSQGHWLEEADAKGVVLGRKLARSLNINLGDEVILLGQSSDGAMANDIFQVRGILKAVGDNIDRAGFFMLSTSFRELMVVNEGVHEIAMKRKDSSETLAATQQRVQDIAVSYEVKDWRSLMPVIARVLELADAQTMIMLSITYVAVGMVILNAMLMSVFERIREFGIMKALGVNPWQIVQLIFAEAMLQAFVASLFALVVGAGLALRLQERGIDFSNMLSATSFAGIALEPIWYARVSFNSLVLPIVFLFLMTLLAVIYPAIKAAVIKPVDAIHHY
ncbi:MAG: ABC transporter permease [Pseudomonadales bacterium]|nr:ABC transporter permease [Pseudomonadales bacterium]